MTRVDDSNGGFGASRRIETEHAHEACLGTEFLQCCMETGARVSLYVEEKLILPGAAVNGAALDFEKIDIVAGAPGPPSRGRTPRIRAAHPPRTRLPRRRT